MSISRRAYQVHLPIGVQVNRPCPDCRHALKKERGGKAATTNRVGRPYLDKKFLVIL
jgi:hypothetical protein